MNVKIHYTFESMLWQPASPGGWHFISLPVEMAREIRDNSKWQEEGWGRMKAKAKIRETLWDTAIWYDTKLNTYILPVKADIRKKEKIEIGNILDVEITL